MAYIIKNMSSTIVIGWGNKDILPLSELPLVNTDLADGSATLTFQQFTDNTTHIEEGVLLIYDGTTIVADARNWISRYYNDPMIAFNPSTSSGDMTKSVYDINNNGIVDDSEKLGGHSSAYYATKAELDGKEDWLNLPATEGQMLTSSTDGARLWVDIPVTSSTFTDLSDTPADYNGQKGKVVRVNNTQTGLEFVDMDKNITAAHYKFTLTTTPPVSIGYIATDNAVHGDVTKLYISVKDADGHDRTDPLIAISKDDILAIEATNYANYKISSNDGPDVGDTYWTFTVVPLANVGWFSEDELVNVSGIFSGAKFFDDLVDTPSGKNGSAGKFVKVSNDETQLEYGDATFLNLLDTPDVYTGNAGKFASVNSAEDGLEFSTPVSGELSKITEDNKTGYYLKDTDRSYKAGIGEKAIDLSISDGGHYDNVDYGASGENSVAVGYNTKAFGDYSYAEGYNTRAGDPMYSNALGGDGAHAEGRNTGAIGSRSHAEGDYSYAYGKFSHVEGVNTNTTTNFPDLDISVPKKITIERYYDNVNIFENVWRVLVGTNIGGVIAFRWERVYSVEFKKDKQKVILNVDDNSDIYIVTYGAFDSSHAEGNSSRAMGMGAHAEGIDTYSYGDGAHAEGSSSRAYGNSSHSEGGHTRAEGAASHSEGDQSVASGLGSHAEGYQAKAIGVYSHAEGGRSNAYRSYCHAEGVETKAYGEHSHTEGMMSHAYGTASHAEGGYTYAKGDLSHVEGQYSNATTLSHAEGYYALAFGNYSHAEGYKVTLGKEFSNPDISTANTIKITGDVRAYFVNTINTMDSLNNSIVCIYFDYSTYTETYDTLTITGDITYDSTSNTTSIPVNKSVVHLTKTYSNIMGSHASGIHTNAMSDGSHVEGLYGIATTPGSHVEGAACHTVKSHSVNVDVYARTLTISGGDFTSDFDIGTSIYVVYNDYRGYTNSNHYTRLINISGISYDSSNSATILTSDDSFLEGIYKVVSNKYLIGQSHIGSHAEGEGTESSGGASHSEGIETKAQGEGSHAEGFSTAATGIHAHAEGKETLATGKYSHAGGLRNKSIGNASFSHGSLNESLGFTSVSNGQGNKVFGDYSTINGQNNLSHGYTSSVEGKDNVMSIPFDVDSVNGLYIVTSGDNIVSFYYNTSINLNAIMIESPTGIVRADITAYPRYDSATDKTTIKINKEIPTATKIWSNASASHIEGYNNKISASFSHVEGSNNIAYSRGSHVEGMYNKVTGYYSCHAEGWQTEAYGDGSHSEGNGTKALGGHGSHAEGMETTATGSASHTEGDSTEASGDHSHAEGYNTKALKDGSHAEGANTEARGNYTHAEGVGCIAIASFSHAEGYNTKTESNAHNAHVEGKETIARGDNAHAEGYKTTAERANSHAEGEETNAYVENSHAEGKKTFAGGWQSHAEGLGCWAHADNTHAEGVESKAFGMSSHAEGYKTYTNSNNAHSEGYLTAAKGVNSHSEGGATEAIGGGSHAEGNSTKAIGYNAHSEGNYTIATGNHSHAGGEYTEAKGIAATAIGKYNNPDADNIFEIGVGTSDTDRKNALESTNTGILSAPQQNGNITEDDHIATKKYVDDNGGGGGGDDELVKVDSTDTTGGYLDAKLIVGNGISKTIVDNSGNKQVKLEVVPPLYGTTPERPANPPFWQEYFDTELGYPIWWNGTEWVNATGAPV